MLALLPSILALLSILAPIVPILTPLMLLLVALIELIFKILPLSTSILALIVVIMAIISIFRLNTTFAGGNSNININITIIAGDNGNIGAIFIFFLLNSKKKITINWIWKNRLKKLLNKIAEHGLKPLNTSILLLGAVKKKVEKIRNNSKKIGIKKVKLQKKEDKNEW